MYWPIDRLLRPGETALTFCQTLMRETGIAITPGNDFDPVNGTHFVRVSFAGREATVTEAADLFETWAKARL